MAQLDRKDFTADKIFSFGEFRKEKGIRETYSDTSFDNRLKVGDLDFVLMGGRRFIVWNEKADVFEVDKETRVARKERKPRTKKQVVET